ncbi:unnamed protein product, partial [Meganyctiphanes norvegica]
MEEDYFENNCSYHLDAFNDTFYDYFSNDTLEEDYSVLNCSSLEHIVHVNCTSNFLCQCLQDYYRENCPIIHEPEYYSYVYRVIGTVFQSIIFLIGVVGNVMVVIVVARNKNMKTPTNCYLVSLAIADCAVLVAAVPSEIVTYYLIGNHWIWGKAGCAILIFLQHLGINASSLSLTAFTVERYIAICHPMKSQRICTAERAKKITLFVWVFAVCYCSPWLFLTTLQPINYRVDYPVEQCTFKLSREQYIYIYLTDIIVFYAIPLLLSCILYGLIARILFASGTITKNPIAHAVNGHSDKKRITQARVQILDKL